MGAASGQHTADSGNRSWEIEIAVARQRYVVHQTGRTHDTYSPGILITPM